MDRHNVTSMAEQRQVEEPRLPSISFGWGLITAGDCSQTGGVIHFYPDGTGMFECTTTTTHTNSSDVWHSSFVLYDASGNNLFTCGTADGTNMGVGTPYYWTWTFIFPAQFYGKIASVVQNSSC